MLPGLVMHAAGRYVNRPLCTPPSRRAGAFPCRAGLLFFQPCLGSLRVSGQAVMLCLGWALCSRDAVLRR